VILLNRLRNMLADGTIVLAAAKPVMRHDEMFARFAPANLAMN